MNDTKFRVDFHGIDEITEDMLKAVNRMGEEGGRELAKVRPKLTRIMRRLTRAKVKSDTDLTKGFHSSKVEGYGLDLHFDFMAEAPKTNPHYHLIENGHRIVVPYTHTPKGGKTYAFKSGGQVRGMTQGINVKPQAVKEIAPYVEQALYDTIDKALKANNL